MVPWLKEGRRYLRIYLFFLKNSVISMMEYRINFLFGILIEIGYLAIKFSYVYVIYRIGVSVNGLTPDEILLFVGAFTIMAGLYSMLFHSNFYMLPEHVRTGTLDLMMTKPVSLQFMATLRSIQIGYAVPNVIGGTAMVVWGWREAGVPATFGNVSLFVLYLLIGLLMTYAVFLAPQLIAFWTVKTNGINEASNALFDFNQMPMAIYSKWIQRVGTFFIPVFLITNLSPLSVLGRLTSWQLAWGLVAPVVFLALVRWIWTAAVRNYASASS
ncbi:ABC-2 family transporter protein [Cohnella xylanilytica]|uniref:ABC-2 family transporter protein n=1 Tax=Cohnella xylanilytica TaxID=557555 RepID=A0A841U3D1_9BACL|nr:ABC-2 family transporter protein [Cohnella xylanilytica]MBB6695237.1 ABC-2 family transporter protein [Cohnella xylanilytica]